VHADVDIAGAQRVAAGDVQPLLAAPDERPQ
jgi:hypothetical protein